jgi:hypothetical protein
MEVSNELHKSAALPPVKGPRVTTGWARADLGAEEKRKISCTRRESNNMSYPLLLFCSARENRLERGILILYYDYYYE